MAAQAKTPLDLYHTLAPSAGVPVSPLQVGTMSLGGESEACAANEWRPAGSETRSLLPPRSVSGLRVRGRAGEGHRGDGGQQRAVDTGERRRGASLKKLRTTFIDIFYVHWWDYTTSVAEMMDALHHLVVQGKVIYLVCFPRCA